MWTYENSASTNKDRVRYLIGDTTAPGMLQDEDIILELALVGVTYARPIDQKGCIKAAVAACDALLAKFSTQCDYTIGPESVKASQRVEQLQVRMKSLQAKLQASVAGGPDLIETLHSNDYFRPGVHDGGTTW